MKGTLVHYLFVCIVIAEGALIDEIQKLYRTLGHPFRENLSFYNLPKLEEYDFVVVGSGPAGSAIANRLSEIPDWNVLLLEAGAEASILNFIPSINEFTVLTSYSVNYDVEKEDNVCLGLTGGRCHWPSGNGVGGASIINGMMYTRGHPSDFDRWAMEGATNWSYADVLPYFLKSENMTIPSLAESEFHSTKGPVQVQYSFQTEIGRRFVLAGIELGFDRIDYNNPDTMIGFSQTQTTTKGVRRHSAASAYLLPVKSRPNLHIVKNAYVIEVITEKDSETVAGVKFLKDNRIRTVRVKKEVILSAGAFGSPKILMLSGIGHSEHLENIGIPLVVDLPVGDNLQEHVGTPITFLINTTDSITLPKQIQNLRHDLIQWLNGINGSFANNLPESLGYVKTKYAEDKADIELLLFGGTIAGDGGLLWKNTRNISEEVFKKTWGPVYYAEGFTIGIMGMYPKSRGSVRLKSSDPKEPIVIDCNFLSDPSDIAVLVEGVRVAIKVGEANIFRQIGGKLYAKPVYGCEKHEFNSDEYWDCAIRTVPFQYHHQSGTCRMGADPTSSVVDPRLRVHGVKGLRVADASIIPTIPGVHLMAACYMIGEKAADIIKEDWGIQN